MSSFFKLIFDIKYRIPKQISLIFGKPPSDQICYIQCITSFIYAYISSFPCIRFNVSKHVFFEPFCLRIESVFIYIVYLIICSQLESIELLLLWLQIDWLLIAIQGNKSQISIGMKKIYSPLKLTDQILCV